MDKEDMTTVKERFENKFKKTDGCWDWLAAKFWDGYGKFQSNVAHRVSYRLYIGEIPDGMCCLHRCDNPSCVNPAHLFLGTKADNTHDCMYKGRAAAGEKNGRAKLTEDQVTEIRAMWSYGVRQIDLAVEFRVTKQTIFGIVHHRTWKSA